jgi:GntR family transcriptional regulator/MocR family aminotransferase
LKRHDPLPALALDRHSPDPLHRQLTAALGRAIRSGELAPGAPLPSTRTLAGALGLSRNTVITAYEELTAEGLIAARGGSATRVCPGGGPPVRPDWGILVRGSQYPAAPLRFRDPDGHALYCHFHR